MPHETTPPLILLIDDEPELEVTARYLELEGYSVLTATNGEEGLLALASCRKPCIVLLDLMMPVMDGYGFLRRLHDDATLCGLPVFVLTASFQTERMAGVVGTLRKPLHMELLKEAVAPYWPSSGEGGSSTAG
ncbi:MULTISPECIES: response regulator [unclassified Corallococcus]|uniref:response regulator n=1 Tax=unclassified Corallococcus TaxID=2685029 RepID=UPI001A8F8CD4|nr:response regulator [Corallococcus sp. NCRR]MBN9686912.1 response regulator [Corallococcus sp. NCSPR001]WAS89254.1 response regulator [Corallococcus sp. NCRR]